MLDPDIASKAIRQYGKNIISEFHRSVQLPPQHEQDVLIPVREGGKVAIIGAGIGGLYAAMLLRDKAIPFEILEASDRYGGRLYTHTFSGVEHDYYDVGAMRFPKTPLMNPVFKLFNRLGIWEKDKLIPYIFESPNSMLYYNSVLVQHDKHRGNPEDFGISDITGHTWPELVKNVVDPFAEKLAEDVNAGGKAGWELLMKYDKYSTRAYMAGNRSDALPELDKLGLMPYSLEAVSCCETFDKSTAWYDRGLSETVIETLAFAWPESDLDREIKWFCVDGGSSVICDRMVKYLGIEVDKQLRLNSRVTGIGIPDKGNQGIEVTLADGSTYCYDHVINTTTLSCLRTMDLTSARLDYKQKSCLRELRYGPAIKIGIKFKSAWWEEESRMPFGSIIGGQSFTDNMSRTVIYPSYGIREGSKKSNVPVLIASYAWTDDAIILSALMGPDDYSKSVLKQRILQDLVEVHGLDKNEGFKFLEDQYVDSFPFSWNNNPYSMGAYGFFGPGEFVNLFQNLTRPAALGRLHFAGEAVSCRHAWVVGALEASERAIKEILLSSYKLEKKEMHQFEKKWGWLDEKSLEWSDEAIMNQIAISLERVFPENAEEGC
ncbi:hypothetical protein ACEPAH_3169 [Sanghuangporus vaninii]